MAAVYPTYRRHYAGLSATRGRMEVVAFVVRQGDGPMCVLRVTERGYALAEVHSADPTACELVIQLNNAYDPAGDTRVGECPRGVVADWVEEHAGRFRPGLAGRDVGEMAAAVARWLREAEAVGNE